MLVVSKSKLMLEKEALANAGRPPIPSRPRTPARGAILDTPPLCRLITHGSQGRMLESS